MTLDMVHNALGWSALINYVLLILWFLMFCCMRDCMYRLHNRCFTLPISTFNAIHYAGMGIYSISIVLLNLVPFIALSIVR